MIKFCLLCLCQLSHAASLQIWIKQTYSETVLILGPNFPGHTASSFFPVIATDSLLLLPGSEVAEARPSQVFQHSWSAGRSSLLSSWELVFTVFSLSCTRKRKKQLQRLFFCVNSLMIFITTITSFPAVSFHCSFYLS